MRSYPTLILLQDGEVKATHSGNRELGSLIEFVTTTLNEEPKVDLLYYFCYYGYSCLLKGNCSTS